jgi:hypothetical protein
MSEYGKSSETRVGSGCGAPLALQLAPSSRPRFVGGRYHCLRVHTESYCSLKTEEKTERQCGQHSDISSLELSVNSGMETIHPNKTKKTIKLGTGTSGLFPLGPTDFPERHLRK